MPNVIPNPKYGHLPRAVYKKPDIEKFDIARCSLKPVCRGDYMEEQHFDVSKEHEQSWEEYVTSPEYVEEMDNAVVEEPAEWPHFAKLREIDESKPVYPSQTYLLDGLLPTGEIHVLVGSSGIGKSTFLYDFINRWQHEDTIFGRKATRYPYIILSNDRSKAGIIRTLQRLELNPKLFNIKETLSTVYDGGYMPDGRTQRMSELEFTIRECVKKQPDLRVIFVEGLHIGQAEGNDYGATSRSLKGLNALCQRLNLTIVGTTHTPKHGALQSTREAILGSVANGGMIETVITFARDKDTIKLVVIPRQERELTFWYKWSEDGKLVESDEPVNETEETFEMWLSGKEPHTVVLMPEIIKFFTDMNMSNKSAYKAKDKAVGMGILKDLGKRKGFSIEGAIG
jgi:AAA domain-containing protein